jgi:transcriptional regulator with XRE-family HTH domain
VKNRAVKCAGEIDHYVASRATAFRKQLGLSQQELARRLRLSFQQVQKYEKGVNRIGSGRLYEIADAFGIPIEHFYPPMGALHQADTDATPTIIQEAEFIATPDCSRVVKALMRIDPRPRQKLIALIEELATIEATLDTRSEKGLP